MSAYTQQETQITDANILKECLENQGLKNVEQHTDAQPLVGIGGKVRPETAEIIVRRKDVGSASNDIGFKKQADGTFKAIISSYDTHTKYGTAWMNDLKKMYAEKKIMKSAKQAGLTFIGKKASTDGSFKMRFVKA